MSYIVATESGIIHQMRKASPLRILFRLHQRILHVAAVIACI